MGPDRFAVAELRESLGRPLPELPCKYLYDDRGSELFDEITTLEEYYPTRVETSILEGSGDAIIEAVRPRELVELGSGAGRKIQILLDAMARRGLLERVLLLEINERFLATSVQSLEAGHPGLRVVGIPGDFERDLIRLGLGGDRLILLLASTIGNLAPDEAGRFVGRVARQMAARDAFLVGFDLIKDKAVLERAYNDGRGVTAAFNRNILRVVNARFGGDFDVDAFEHVAFYDEANAWIEMRLRATKPTRARVDAVGVSLAFDAGDEIRTEISCKYDRARAEAVARVGGLVLDRWDTDPEGRFALGLLRRAS